MRELYEGLIDIGISHEENGKCSKYYLEVFRLFARPSNKTEKLEIWLMRDDTSYKYFLGYFTSERTRNAEAKVILRCVKKIKNSRIIIDFVNNEMLLRAAESYAWNSFERESLLMHAFTDEFLEQPVDVVN